MTTANARTLSRLREHPPSPLPSSRQQVLTEISQVPSVFRAGDMAVVITTSTLCSELAPHTSTTPGFLHRKGARPRAGSDTPALPSAAGSWHVTLTWGRSWGADWPSE